MTRFDVCLAETLRWEGGWSNDPHDPGGPTMRGVTIGRYAAHMGYVLGPADGVRYREITAELRQIPDHVVRDIYWRWYWQPCGAEMLPPGLELAVFDFAVNSGHPRAIRHLQKVLGVTIDGAFGPVTRNAAWRADAEAAIRALCDSRRAFLRQIPTFWRFGRGWLRRVDGVEAAALAAAKPALAPTIAAWHTNVQPAANPDVQSASQGRAEINPDAPNMATSKTGRAAELAGGVSGVQLGVEVSGAAARSRGPDGTFDGLSLLLNLLQSPTAWLALAAIAAASYVWLERRRKVRLG